MSEREFDVVVVGMGPGGEHVAETLAEAGPGGRGDRVPAGRRRVPVLGLRPVQDDDQGREPAGRGPPDPRPGRRVESSRRTGRRSRRGSGPRPPTTGTTRSPPTGSPARAARCSAATACSPGRARSTVGERGAAGPPRDRAQPRHLAAPSRRSPGLAGTPYWTNREAIETEQVPDSLLVLGGGPIGVELGQVFARFGARGHDRRAGRPAAVGGGAGVQRAAGPGLQAGGHLGVHRVHRRVGDPRRRRVRR